MRIKQLKKTFLGDFLNSKKHFSYFLTQHYMVKFKNNFHCNYFHKRYKIFILYNQSKYIKIL